MLEQNFVSNCASSCLVAIICNSLWVVRLKTFCSQGEDSSKGASEPDTDEIPKDTV